MFEDFQLHHLGLRLRQRLVGRRVAGVQVAGVTRLLIRWEGEPDRCLAELEPDRPALRIVAAARDDALPWTNCPAVEEALAGRRLAALDKAPDDRRLTLAFEGIAGGPRLAVEIRPIAPSLHLCGPDGVIVFSLGPLRSQLQPVGARYREPSRPGRIAPDPASLRAALAEAGAGGARTLLGRVQRLSPLLLEEALVRAHRDEPDALAAALAEVVEAAYAPADDGVLYTRRAVNPGEYRVDPRADVRLGTFPLQLCRDWTAVRFDRFEDAADRWLDYAAAHRRFTGRRDAAVRAQAAPWRKAQDRIRALERELERAAAAEAGRRHGELILAHLHTFGAAFRGEVVEVPDVYEPGAPPVRIPLDPERTLRENADQLFRRWRKARQAREQLPARLEAERDRAAGLERKVLALRAAVSDAELAAAPPASDAGPPRSRGRAGREAAPPGHRFRRFRTRGGLEVRVGRSAAENDRLTFRTSRPDDVWLHAADYPGSHVVLTWGQKGEPPPADLREAAAVAAWYSGARHETAVDVRWTRSKYVQKVKGTAGLVRLMKFRTLRVVPARPRGADDAEPEP